MYSKSLECLEKSLLIIENPNSLNNIAQIYLHEGNSREAHKYLKQALKIVVDSKDNIAKANTLNDISQVYDKENDFKQALKYLKKSLKVCKQENYKIGEGTALNNIAQIYRKENDLENSLIYFKKSLEISREIKDSIGICVALFNLGDLYIHNNKEKAIKVWISAYIIAKDIEYIPVLEVLEHVANQLGSEYGLATWENLAQQIEN